MTLNAGLAMNLLVSNVVECAESRGYLPCEFLVIYENLGRACELLTSWCNGKTFTMLVSPRPVLDLSWCREGGWKPVGDGQGYLIRQHRRGERNYGRRSFVQWGAEGDCQGADRTCVTCS